MKTIIVDVDGVLVDWVSGFKQYMISNGYHHGDSTSYKLSDWYDLSEKEISKHVTAFNKSDDLLKLKPLRDAAHYINKLHNEQGYRFHAITSMGTEPQSIAMREQNLHELFTRDVFIDITYVELNKSKHNELEPYRDSGLFWIEDKYSNAEIGYNLGLKSILMVHDYNAYHNHPGITKVKTWAEVYDLIIL